MTPFSSFRTPAFACLMIALAFTVGVAVGLHQARMEQDVATALAGRESAERLAAAQAETIAANGRTADAVAQAAASAETARQSDAARAVSDAEAARSASALDVARRSRRAVESDPDASLRARLDAAAGQADACDAALIDERDAHDVTREALRTEQASHADDRKVIASFRDAMAATNERAASLDLALEQSRAQEFKLAARSHRRGTAIAAAFAAGVIVPLALERL